MRADEDDDDDDGVDDGVHVLGEVVVAGDKGPLSIPGLYMVLVLLVMRDSILDRLDLPGDVPPPREDPCGLRDERGGVGIPAIVDEALDHDPSTGAGEGLARGTDAGEGFTRGTASDKLCAWALWNTSSM